MNKSLTISSKLPVSWAFLGNICLYRVIYIRLFSRREDSAWHLLTEGMKSGGNFKKDVNVFINFQLTNKRAKLAKIVRKARKDSKIHKYIINQNGAIKVKVSDQDNYIEVNSELSFNNLLRPEVFHDAN